MNNFDTQYLDLCKDILNNGELEETRTGVKSLSIFGRQITYDLREGFPLLTTKKLNFEAIAAELFWFLSGSTNVNDLPEKYQFIWEPWKKDKSGYLGPIYGKQWVNWEKDEQLYPGGGNYTSSINQIDSVIDGLKFHPTSRRHVVSAWNVADLDAMALPPCHVMFQLKAYPPYLDMQMYQRSCDVPVGVPYNIASYSLLLSMIAQEVGLTPRKFIHSMGDCHIYENQIEGINKQITREPLEPCTLVLNNKPFWDLTLSDTRVDNYKSHPFIKFPVAV